MNRRGLTLIELVVGLVTAVIIGAVSASLLKAGIQTYQFSARQNEALTRARKALGGEGSSTGLLRGSRSAYRVSALNASQAAVISTSAVTTSFSVSNNSLYRTVGGTPTVLADKITALTVNYYNLNSSGLIIESTAAVSATLVTALATLQGQGGSKQKSYYLFSGTLLRNHP